jgi:excisionase family DNA binding protein
MNKPTKQLLSVEEVAHILGLSPRTVYNQIHRKAKKKFPVKAVRLGKLVKFKVSDLDDYIRSL